MLAVGDVDARLPGHRSTSAVAGREVDALKRYPAASRPALPLALHLALINAVRLAVTQLTAGEPIIAWTSVRIVGRTCL